MNHCQSILTLPVAAVIATATHWAGALLLAQWLIDQPEVSQRSSIKPLERMLKVPETIRLGRDAPRVSTMAWIPYDNFRELIAPPSKTEQPVLQQQVDPVPNAPTPIDPTPPDFSPAAAVSQTMLAKAASVPSASEAVGRFSPDLADIRVAQTRQTSVSSELSQQDSEHEETVQRSAKTPSPQARRSNPEQPNPTAAPRADLESSATKLESRVNKVIPGRVMVGQGIEIKTVLPRLSTVTWLTTAPNNPVARLVFDHRDGHVIDAKLVKSSGYHAVDSQVVASLYRWRAVGKQLKVRTRAFTMQIELILSAD